MAAKAAGKGAKVRSVPSDLEEVVREAARRAPGVTVTSLRKALPVSHQPFAKEAVALVRELIARRELYGYRKGKTEYLFLEDPVARLHVAMKPCLTDGPHLKEVLKQRANDVAPGHSVAFEEWFKQALAGRKLFERASKPPSKKGEKKKKLYGSEPDLGALANVLTALRKALVKLDQQGIPRQRVADALMAEVGVTATLTPEIVDAQALLLSNGGSLPSGRAGFLAALKSLGQDNPREALLSIRELRPRVTLSKQQFDALALELARDGAISLHPHDLAASLTDSDRAELVQDTRGNSYIGIALRERE